MERRKVSPPRGFLNPSTAIRSNSGADMVCSLLDKDMRGEGEKRDGVLGLLKALRVARWVLLYSYQSNAPQLLHHVVPTTLSHRNQQGQEQGHKSPGCHFGTAAGPSELDTVKSTKLQLDQRANAHLTNFP